MCVLGACLERAIGLRSLHVWHLTVGMRLCAKRGGEKGRRGMGIGAWYNKKKTRWGGVQTGAKDQVGRGGDDGDGWVGRAVDEAAAAAAGAAAMAGGL